VLRKGGRRFLFLPFFGFAPNPWYVKNVVSGQFFPNAFYVSHNLFPFLIATMKKTSAAWLLVGLCICRLFFVINFKLDLQWPATQMVLSTGGHYSIPPFSSLPLPNLEVEPLLSENMFCYPSYAQGRFDPDKVEDRSFLRLLPHSIHKHLCELNKLNHSSGECERELPLDLTLNAMLPPRRVYLDIGANSFGSSVGWMKRNYPIDFSEIYTWEEVASEFKKPTPQDATIVYNLTADTATRWLDSITFFPTRVSAALTDHSPGDLSHFLLTCVKRKDYCVVKMDIEGEEWNVIPRLELTSAIRRIDELMVEFHYYHPMMYANLWTRDHFSHTLEETEAFMRQLQSRDSLVFHYWP
jgi:hypothetical protein